MAYETTLTCFIELCVPEADRVHLKKWGQHILNCASQESAIALRWHKGRHLPQQFQIQLCWC